MVILTTTTLANYFRQQPESERALKAWAEIAQEAMWSNPQELTAQIRNASVVGNVGACTRVVFNIKGDDYRLVVDILFKRRTIFIIWIGTHKEYDKINVATYQRQPY